MAPKAPKTSAIQAPSLEEMREMVAAADLQAKADALAAKEAARKAVGRPALVGERKQATYHVLIAQDKTLGTLAIDQGV